MTNNAIGLTLNGLAARATCPADTTVLQWLRTVQRLTGTKEGCAEGDCGACTVLLSKADGSAPIAVNSCILSMGQVAGCSLTTVEGLATQTLHPLQSAMAENGSSQCGFCTPGIVMSLAGLMANTPHPSEQTIHDTLAGNLCRCTGYKPIVEAAKKVAAAGLHALNIPDHHQTETHSPNITQNFFAPNSLSDLYKLRDQNPEATLLAGGTDLGLALAEHEAHWPAIIWTGAVKELLTIKDEPDAWHFGAAVTWSQIQSTIGDACPSLTTLLRRFGSVQIRNMGTIGGNIGTASPIGDGPPALIALGAHITLASAKSERTIALEDFFLDYRKTALQNDEIITFIIIPKPTAIQHFRVWKISKRYDQDISTVCGAFNLMLQEDRIASARVAFGGMAAIPKRVPEAEAALIGLSIKTGDFTPVANAIRAAFAPLSDWRGTAAYRTEVAGNLAHRLAADLKGEPVEVVTSEAAS